MICGIGVLFLKNWARLTALIFTVPKLLNSFILFIGGRAWSIIIHEPIETWIFWVFQMIFLFILIVFFSIPKVKEQFKWGQWTWWGEWTRNPHINCYMEKNIKKKILKCLIIRYLLTITLVSLLLGGSYILWKPIVIELFYMLFASRWPIYVFLASGIFAFSSNVRKKPYNQAKWPEKEKEIFAKAEDLFQKSMLVIFCLALMVLLVNDFIICLK